MIEPGLMLHEALTTREREVLALLAQGYTRKQIRQALCIADGTLSAHIGNIHQKLNIEGGGSARLIIRAIELGLVRVNHAHQWHDFRQCSQCGLVDANNEVSPVHS